MYSHFVLFASFCCICLAQISSTVWPCPHDSHLPCAKCLAENPSLAKRVPQKEEEEEEVERERA